MRCERFLLGRERKHQSAESVGLALTGDDDFPDYRQGRSLRLYMLVKIANFSGGARGIRGRGAERRVSGSMGVKRGRRERATRRRANRGP